MSLLWSLKNFDAYRKPMDDFRVKTLSGGLVTLIATIAISLLIVLETRRFLTIDVLEHLFVDSTTSDERVYIEFDVTFNKLPCNFITVDVMDISSEAQENINDDIYRLRLDSEGRNISETAQKIEINQNKTLADPTGATKEVQCGSCYGAAPDGTCCNTCEDVKGAYAVKGWQVNIEEVEQCKNDKWVKEFNEHKNEGCRVYGTVKVAKVAGNFHLAPGDPHQAMRSHVHDLHNIDPSKFDASHTVNHVSFGKSFPGKAYPLDGKVNRENRGGIMYQYFVKVVPTRYDYLDGKVDQSHQFSVTTYKKDLGFRQAGLPGFFLQYEFSPLMVQYEEFRQSFASFLVNLCAIVGGVFAMAQLVDITIYHTSRYMKARFAEGKLI
uniref:Endoplasmic reticulum-Golgi intermediate compartment protein 3 n=1 Tax=Caenorhabditis japonica TaxID=281687 RepID=A0A8R1DPW7_CAEJA